jgi:hypothetical protein
MVLLILILNDRKRKKIIEKFKPGIKEKGINVVESLV